MHASGNKDDVFSDRFQTREQVKRYRDRYTTGHRGRVHQLELAALTQILEGLSRGETVLDLPCGTGRLAPVLASVADRIIMADSSQAMLELARQDNSETQFQVTYLLTRIEQIELANDSVDIAICHRLLHHIHNRSVRLQIVRELSRVSGRYVIISYFPSGFRTRLRWQLRRLTGKADKDRAPVSFNEFLAETRSASLRFVRSTEIRRFPKAVFCLFERTDVAASTLPAL